MCWIDTNRLKVKQLCWLVNSIMGGWSPFVLKHTSDVLALWVTFLSISELKWILKRVVGPKAPSLWHILGKFRDRGSILSLGAYLFTSDWRLLVLYLALVGNSGVISRPLWTCHCPSIDLHAVLSVAKLFVSSDDPHAVYLLNSYTTPNSSFRVQAGLSLNPYFGVHSSPLPSWKPYVHLN